MKRKTQKIVGIFMGHLHDKIHQVETIAGIPRFFCGSVVGNESEDQDKNDEYRTYLKVDFKSDKMIVSAISSKNGVVRVGKVQTYNHKK